MSLGARLRGALLMALVAALSLGLLIYVGWGAAKRAYPGFMLDKLAAQGAIVESAMSGHLRAGLPLSAFPGFERIAGPLRESDPGIAAIVLRDGEGATVFSVGDEAPAGPVPTPGQSRATASEDGWLLVSLPLENRFERVGRLELAMRADTVAARIGREQPMLAALASGLSLLFGLLAFRAAGRGGSAGGGRAVLVFTLIFLVMAGAVATDLARLYSEGAQARARAISDSLARRIEPLFAYGLTLEDVSGVGALMADQQRLNQDVEAVGLIQDGVVTAHSDPSKVGRPWSGPPGAFEYIVPVGGAQNEIRVGVMLPAEIVWGAMARSVKNFAALLLASGLFASVFLGLARALERRGEAGGERERGEHVLALMRPVFFLAVFADFLTAGFLPQLLGRLAREEGLREGAASYAFTAYFGCFLLSLLPVTALAERRGPRAAILLGAMIVAMASALPVLLPGFWPLAAARALAGAGQAALLIGVQNAAFAAAPEGRARAAATIVLGFNGGMIAGAAIGSLLVADLGARGVFGVAAAAALSIGALASALLARGRIGDGWAQSQGDVFALLRDVPRAFASPGFLGAFLLVGAPAKAALTGVIVFGAPLFLGAQGWAAEDIGQLMMLYAAAVLAATGPVARHVDRAGRGREALIAGGAVSALGVALIGGSALWAPEGWPAAAMAASGVILTGLAHGCVNAPVIAYVAGTGAARRLGAPTATALYRFLERAGHVAGPGIVGFALARAGEDGSGFVWIGGALLALTVAFVALAALRDGGATA